MRRSQGLVGLARSLLVVRRSSIHQLTWLNSTNVQAANRLAQPHMHPVACSINSGLQSGYRGLSDASTATIDQLLDLHDALLERTSGVQRSAEDGKSAGQKRKRDAHGDSSTAGEPCARARWCSAKCSPAGAAPVMCAGLPLGMLCLWGQ